MAKTATRARSRAAAKPATRVDPAAARDTGAADDRVAGPTIRVRATAVCFYGDVRHRVGDVFDLYPRHGTFTELERDEKGKPLLNEDTVPKSRLTKETDDLVLSAEDQFNPKCMERVADDEPERAVSAQERIAAEHDRILKARLSGNAAMVAPSVRAQGPSDSHRIGGTGDTARTSPATGDEDVLNQ